MVSPFHHVTRSTILVFRNIVFQRLAAFISIISSIYYIHVIMQHKIVTVALILNRSHKGIEVCFTKFKMATYFNFNFEIETSSLA